MSINEILKDIVKELEQHSKASNSCSDKPIMSEFDSARYYKGIEEFDKNREEILKHLKACQMSIMHFEGLETLRTAHDQLEPYFKQFMENLNVDALHAMMTIRSGLQHMENLDHVTTILCAVASEILSPELGKEPTLRGI